MTDRFHDDEVRIDVELVSQLVGAQYPESATLPLRRLDATGSTHVLFRLGDQLVVRLPRQPGGSAGIVKQRRWMPTIGPYLPVAVPAIVALGRPGRGFGER